MRKRVAAIACSLGCTLACSQTPSATPSAPLVEHTAAQIEEHVRTLTEKARASPAGFAAETWERYGDHFSMLAVRVRTGGGEVHVHTADYFYVIHGHATELAGGTLEDGKDTEPGERRGASVQGGTSHNMGPGDFLHIAPNTPHQTISGEEPFVYLIIKAAE